MSRIIEGLALEPVHHVEQRCGADQELRDLLKEARDTLSNVDSSVQALGAVMPGDRSRTVEDFLASILNTVERVECMFKQIERRQM